MACAVAAPRPIGEDAQVVRYDIQAETDGSFSSNVELTDGTILSQEGQGGVYAKGLVSYTSPEGIPIQLTYVADENGYQPQSDVLPIAPPIPEDIAKSIRYIQEHPTPEELADREVRARQF